MLHSFRYKQDVCIILLNEEESYYHLVIVMNSLFFSAEPQFLPPSPYAKEIKKLPVAQKETTVALDQQTC